MRYVLLLALLLGLACVAAIDLRNIKDFKKHIIQKIKNVTTTGIRGKLKSIKETFMATITNKLKKLKSSIMKSLKLSERQQADLDKRMKEIKNITHDHKNPMGDSIFDVNVNSDVASTLYQSDIMLTKQQAQVILNEPGRGKRQAFRDERYPATIWQNGVNFHFHETADDNMRRVFYKAAMQWMENTCINFFEDGSAPDRILIGKGEGCYSFVGRIGGEQNLSLGVGCDSVGTAAHELGHALGFFHPMSRHDRDQFITINVANIRPDFVDQFNVESQQKNHNYGMTYDFGSIMHYGSTSASLEQKTTMVAYDTAYQRTMGSHLISFLDLSMMNEHYNCKANCPAFSSARCQNGGFPHPRNCSKCICPTGFGGDFCDQRPPGCGQILEAMDATVVLKDTNGGEAGVRDEFTLCNYWIVSPPGTQIAVQLVSVTPGYAHDGCVFGGVEIKSNPDMTKTGYRFCAPEDSGATLVSSANILPIITFNRAETFETVLQYRIVGGSGSPDPYPAPPVDPFGRCVDTSPIECPSMAASGFCASPYYTFSFKKYVCARSCNIC